MAPRRLLLLLLLLVAVATASSLPAAPSTAANHEPEPPSRELPAADPAAAAFPGACGGLVIPPHMIRAAVPAGRLGVFHVTVVLRATRRGGHYHVVPGDDGDDGRHREEFVPMLITCLVVWGVTFILFICIEMIIGLRGDGDEGDEAYSAGDGAVPMKSVLVELAHADAVKVKQPRGDN